MYRKLRQQQPALVNRRGSILLHDNARPHFSQIIVRKLNQLNVEVLPQPLYSPDLSPTDYHLFSPVEPSAIKSRQKRPLSTSSNHIYVIYFMIYHIYHKMFGEIFNSEAKLKLSMDSFTVTGQ